MNHIQAIEEQQYSEAARYDRFDGFDCGDLGMTDDDFRDQGSECIGRMRSEAGVKVEVFRSWSEREEFFCVVLTQNEGGKDAEVAFDDFPNGRESALAYGRWWLAGCPR